MRSPRRFLHGLSVPLVTAALTSASVVGAVAAPPARADVSDAELAYRWAPIHHQDTDNTDAHADYLTTVNYDGEWSTNNNWEHQDDDQQRLTGAAYYSVVETRTHWFVVYAFYHPRDWCDTFLCERFDAHHENDMEGLLLTVRKDGSTYGRLEAMVTVAHRDFYSYIPPGGGFDDGQENIDGTIVLRAHDGTDRPTTFQEAKGHGLFAWNGHDFPGGDGVIYYPSRTTGDVPESGDDPSARYRLVDIFAADGLWDRRHATETFASFGTFRGDNGADNAANAPWRWDDHDDGGDLVGGELATEPAKLIAIYFSNRGDFSRTYQRNGYTG
ncbi:MAG: hypothetical protein ACRD29_19705 [Acidimicrobiales bacterium]